MGNWVADDRKLRELILYIAHRSKDDPHMGAVKLNKVLFRCDFGAYLHLGVPITGHPYFKLPQGPAPRRLLPIRREMIEEDIVRLEEEESGAVKPLNRLVPRREPDLNIFSDDQLAFIDGVLDFMLPLTGTQAANDSHLMVGWRVAGKEEDIPYQTALIADRASDADITRGHELASRYGWA